MTVVRELRVGDRSENGAQEDRAVVLSGLSKELAERLGKHPLPPRMILPMARPPSPRRWLARAGLVTVIGAFAAAVTLTLSGVPWKLFERKGHSLTRAEEGAAAMPLSPIATATAQSASVAAEAPDLVPSQPPAVQVSQQPREQAIALPAAPPPAPALPVVDRELTWTEVHELQARLRALQFDPGPLDGVRGPLTSAAVRRFQESRGQRASGDATLGILIQLREVSSRAD